LHTQSNDGGSTWSEADTVLNIPNAWLYETHMVCNTNNQLVVSFDSISWGGTYTQVYAMIFNGISWSPPVKLSSNNNAKGNKLIADHAGRVYCFWHELYNGNTKFMYRVYENEQWGETVIPYSDTNVYVLENLDVDTDNNLHGIGYFNYQNQTSDDMATTYFLYEKFNNQWALPYFVSYATPFQGCDIVSDNLLLPQTVISAYISQVPIDYVTMHRKEWFLGWEPIDTVSVHKEEYYPLIEINSDNSPDYIITELITNSNLLLKDYYKIDDNFIIELIDSNGSILFSNIQKYNSEFKLVYGKLPLNSVFDNNIFYTTKSLNVSRKGADPSILTKIFPNPCEKELNISLYMESSCKCSIRLVDISGKIILHEERVNLDQGNNLIKLNLNRINNNFSPSKSSYLVIQSEKFKLIKPILILN